ncbi:farnesyl cysteine-carboxyl methyltransferase [Saitoella coloradoensis]
MSNPNAPDGVALRASLLGAVFGASSVLACVSSPAHPAGFIFVALLAIFHILEYYVTARYNPIRVKIDSFLLSNGIGYPIAQACGILEFLIELYYFPELKTVSNAFYLGLAITLFGQVFRFIAMAQAAQSFNHQVQSAKLDDHVLVTDGLYKYFRHPSYFGFFWWGIGSQIMLANPVSIIAFGFVLWRFFSQRIEGEEKFLVKFFGDSYVRYRERVPTRIPFIR